MNDMVAALALICGLGIIAAVGFLGWFAWALIDEGHLQYGLRLAGVFLLILAFLVHRAGIPDYPSARGEKIRKGANIAAVALAVPGTPCLLASFLL